MELASTPTGRTVVVPLDDALPAQGVVELRHRLREVLAAGDARLVVDVAGVDRVSSAVVAALLWATRQGRARGVEVVIRGAGQHGQGLLGPGLLGRTGLGDVLQVEPAGRG
ncbi:hypothetical protein GCM10027446_10800 [Angustibacter peucedani]